MEEIWMKIKENYAAVLAVGTAFVTVIYAMLRFMMFLYWSGYFKALNIDINLMSLDYSGMILYAIFIGLVLLMLCYISWAMYSTISKINTNISEQDGNGKITKIKCFLSDFLVSIIFMLLGDTPLILIAVVVTRIDLTFVRFVYIFCMLYTAQMLIVWLEHGKERKFKIETYFFAAIVGMPLLVAFVYFGGSNSIKQTNNLRVTDDEKYAIVYCDGERYILEPVEFTSDTTVIINTCNQRIVEVSEVEIVNVSVECVELK